MSCAPSVFQCHVAPIVSSDHSYAQPSRHGQGTSRQDNHTDHCYARPSATCQGNASQESDDVSNKTTLKVIFWNVDGRERFNRVFGGGKGDNALNTVDILSKSDVAFLSETWLPEARTSSCLTHKDFFCSPAVPTGGRASGGIECYTPPSGKGKLISSSQHHLVVQLEELYVMGVYYKPSLEFDDKMVDLVSALSLCTGDKPIVLGGDFNIRKGTADFRHLKLILSNYQLSLISDPNTPSFVGHAGNSTPDHIFCSDSVQVNNCITLQRTESVHMPVMADLSIRRAQPEKLLPPRKLDLESCKLKLIEIQVPEGNDSENASLEDLVEKVSSAFTACLHPRDENPRVNFSHKIRAMKERTKEAFDLYSRYRVRFFKEVYFILRREEHKEIFAHRTRTQESKVVQLLNETARDGIRALFKSARPPRSNDSSQVPLKEWFDCFSELYQSFDEPTFTPIPTVPTEEADKLIAPFTEQEIYDALTHQSSRAPGMSGVSPNHLKLLREELTPLLTHLFNEIISKRGSFPETWLQTMFFFIHKKGSFSDPSNYRSLAIEDPFLKVFTTAVCTRLTVYSESNNLLPEYQFGFRKNHSTSSATTILKQCVEESFQKKKRVYACFVDYKKAFDLVDRGLLFTKLQRLGIPTSFAKMLFTLLSDMRFRIRSNGCLSPEFESFNGVPQGDPLSPLLFSLFTADLPDFISHTGVYLGNTEIKYLLYADDLVLLANQPCELQKALDQLSHYVGGSKLTVNVLKTKCMAFYHGPRPTDYFHFNGKVIENCNEFTYLGVVFTTRLSARKHIEHVVSKCNGTIGVLFSRIPIKSIPLSVALNLFNIYVLPIITYALPVWFHKSSEDGRKKLNAVFTKFMKRYLGIPYSSYNAIVHYLAGTVPLCNFLQNRSVRDFFNIPFPDSLRGCQFNPPTELEELKGYNVYEEVPSFFWLSRVPEGDQLPTNPDSRRALLYDMMDLFHPHVCIDGEFHIHPSDWCNCVLCAETVEHYHHRTCPVLKDLNPCAVMRRVFPADPLQ